MAYTSPIIPSAANIYNNQQPYPYPTQAAPAGMYYQPPYQQSFQITRVNGENGAKAFQMPPNSSIILLDESKAKVYIKETDGASYPKLSCYKLVPEEEEVKESADMEKQFKAIDDRVKVLERWVLNSKKVLKEEQDKEKE